MFPFALLSNTFQEKYFKPTVNGLNQVLFALFQRTFRSGDWRSIFITPRARQAAMATLSSNKPMVAHVKNSFSDTTSATIRRAKYRLNHSPGYEGMLSRSQAFPIADKISRPERIHKVKEWFLHKIQSNDQLSISCSSVNLMVDSACTLWFAHQEPLTFYLLTSLPEKSPVRMQSSQALMNKLNLLLRYSSRKLCNIFPGSAVPTSRDRTIPSLEFLNAWIWSMVKILTTKNVRSGSRKKQYGDF